MKEQSTTKGFAVLSAAGMLIKVLSILYVPLLMAIIGDVGYGIYGASYQIYTFVFVLTNSGVPVAISKLISELTALGNYRDAVRGFKIARFILVIIGIFMSIMLIVFAMPLARLTDERAYLSLVSLSPAILFTSVSSSYRGYFQGRGNMTPTAVSQVIEQTLNIIFSIAFAAYLIKYGVEAGTAGSTIGTSLGALASASFLMFCYNRNRSFRERGNIIKDNIRRFSNKQLLRKIINYGIPITLCVGMTYAGNIVDVINTRARLVAGGFTSDGAIILYGYLTKYQQLLNVPIAIISSLTMAILPAISAAAAVRDTNRVKHSINYSFRLCFLIALPCAAGLAILSGPIFTLLKFRGGSYIMACGSVVLVLMSVMQIQTTILQSIGKLYSATIYSVIGIVCKIGINYVLIAIPRINILGAIAGSIIGYLVPIVLNHRMIKKSLGVHIGMLVHAVKPLISSIVMGILVFFVYYILNLAIGLVKTGYISNAVSTIVAIILGLFTYIFVLAVTGGITKEDLAGMPNKLTRFIPKFIYAKIK